MSTEKEWAAPGPTKLTNVMDLPVDTQMTDEKAAALRKPFDKKSVGKLPKPYKKDSPKGDCQECGGYHGLPAMHLDFAGHAVVTDRLLKVDPEWTWTPMATSPEGLPLPDGHGNLWILLTVCGVTRPGVGDGNNMKELIGDAIRNAAMRFGVALDLWSKEELEQVHSEDVHKAPAPRPEPRQEAVVYGNRGSAETTTAPVLEELPDLETPDEKKPKATKKAIANIGRLSKELGLDRDGKLMGVAVTIGREVESTNDLSPSEASSVIESMQATVDARKASQEAK